jgi:predicted secreted protein
MKWTSAIAIYFIIWWLVLFLVLPFGIKNANETGADVEVGNDAGAPVRHGVAWKALVTTVLATVVYVAVYWALTNSVLEHLQMPFFPAPHSL